MNTRRSFLGMLCGGAAAAAATPLMKTAQAVEKKLLIPEGMDESAIAVADDEPLVLADESFLWNHQREVLEKLHGRKHGKEMFFGADNRKVKALSPVQYEGFLADHMAVNAKYGVRIKLQELFNEWHKEQLLNPQF